MLMSKLRVSLVVLALVVGFGLTAGSAQAVEPVTGGCSLDVAALASTALNPAALVTPLPQIDTVGNELTVPEPEFLANYTGYCRCSCSRVKNCRTSADCGGSPCMGGISCC